MKKNVLRKDFFMEIRKTLGRFVSIFFIVALGVAFYSGIRASEPSMRISGDAYFDKMNLMDVKVMGSMGLTREDIQAIGNVNGIELAEGGYSKDVLCPADDTEKVVHMLSTQESFNTVQVAQGRLPEKAGECLLDEDFLKYKDYKIGDKIKFRSGDDEALTESLVTDTYTVVGIGNSPLYISLGRGNSLIGNGEVSGFVIVDASSFDMDVYTEAYVRVSKILDTTAFTEEYGQLSDAAVEALEGIEKERCRIRREEILKEANEEVADAEKTVNEEAGKLEDAKIELEDAKSTAAKELTDARKKLEDGETELIQAQQQIADGEAQIKSGKSELEKQQNTLNAAKAEWESGVAQVEKNAAELAEGETAYLEEYLQFKPLIDAGKEKIENGKAELEQGKAELASGLEAVNTGITNLEMLQTGIQDTQTGLQEAQSGETLISEQIEEGEKLLTEYEGIPKEERTPEQQEFVENWAARKAGYEARLSELKQLQAELAGMLTVLNQQMNEAGYENTEQLAGAIEGLKVQKAVLEEKAAELGGQEAILLEQEKELLDQEQTLLEAGETIKEGKAQIAEARSQLRDAKAQIDSGQSQIDSAWALIKDQEQALVSGREELARGLQELADGQSEYEQAAADAAAQIAEGEEKLADGEKKLAEAKQEIADAKAEIEKIENPKWYVQDRSDALTAYDGYGENADRMRSIGQVFPALFFLVAALISLTSMTRMVEEQRVQIGTMKALGYGKFSIAKKYIYYALAATLGGSVAGVLLGEKIFPFIIIYAYKILYQHIPDILVPYHMSYAVQATVIAVFCTLFATIASCYKELAAQPAQLMRPPSPKQGKRILLERMGWIWKRLNFSWKSSVRNMIRYKKRFFMTVFGIGGCMALMVVGFGLKDCIYEIVTLQYEKIQFYDATVYMEDTISGEERNEIQQYLGESDSVEAYIQSRMQKVELESDTSKQSVYLTVPEDSKRIEKFLSFHSRTKDEIYSLAEDKVILTEKMAQLLDVEVGDTVTIKDEEKGDREVQIGAICENYMGHYLYVDSGEYEEIYGAPPKFNSIFYQMKDGKDEQIEDIGTELLSYESVLNVSYSSSIEGQLDDMLKSLNLVIVVLIVSAGMLAFVVLYNLNNINITERKRELATLKVLGFYDAEVATYVYRENVMLTFLGAIAGIVLGNILHRFVIVTVEVNEAMFGREIHWQSYLYSFLFTVGFSIFVNLVMYFKLKKIDMVESLKSVE